MSAVEIMDILPPPVPGYRCLLCRYRCCGLSSQRNHFSQFHAKEKFQSSHFESCLMQAWYGKDCGTRPAGERYQLVVALADKPKEPVQVFLDHQHNWLGKMAVPDDPNEVSNREVHVFLDRTKFHLIYPSQNDCVRLHELCQLPTRESYQDYDALLSWVKSYMTTIEAAAFHLPSTMLRDVTRTRKYVANLDFVYLLTYCLTF
jgi:hypothetical protein